MASKVLFIAPPDGCDPDSFLSFLGKWHHGDSLLLSSTDNCLSSRLSLARSSTDQRLNYFSLGSLSAILEIVKASPAVRVVVLSTSAVQELVKVYRRSSRRNEIGVECEGRIMILSQDYERFCRVNRLPAAQVRISIDPGVIPLAVSSTPRLEQMLRSEVETRTLEYYQPQTSHTSAIVLQNLVGTQTHNTGSLTSYKPIPRAISTFQSLDRDLSATETLLTEAIDMIFTQESLPILLEKVNNRTITIINFGKRSFRSVFIQLFINEQLNGQPISYTHPIVPGAQLLEFNVLHYLSRTWSTSLLLMEANSMISNRLEWNQAQSMEIIREPFTPMLVGREAETMPRVDAYPLSSSMSHVSLLSLPRRESRVSPSDSSSLSNSGNTVVSSVAPSLQLTPQEMAYLQSLLKDYPMLKNDPDYENKIVTRLRMGASWQEIIESLRHY